MSVTESALAASRSADPVNWVDRGLGRAVEPPDVVVDPFAWLASSPAAFLIEHLQPFKNLLDSLKIDATAIEAYADKWAGIATSLTAAQVHLVEAVATDTAGWQGAAANAYRRKAAGQADAIRAAAVAAGTVGPVAMTMGQVVDLVRDGVHRLITELVRMLITWVEEAIFSFGLAMPFVVAQAASATADWATKVNTVLDGLTGTQRGAETALGGLVNVFTEIMQGLGDLPVVADPVLPVIPAIPPLPPPPSLPPPSDPPVHHGPPPAVEVRHTVDVPPPPFQTEAPAPVPLPETDAPARDSGGYDPGSPGATSPAGEFSSSAPGTAPSPGPQEQPRAFPTQAIPSASEPGPGAGGAPTGQPGRPGTPTGSATGRRTFGGWTGTPGSPAPSAYSLPRTTPQSSSSKRPTRSRPSPAAQTDDELYEFLGMVLRGTDDSPAESRRRGRTWLNGETQRLWQQIHDSDTYLAWLESAGTGQLIDQDTVATILRGQGTDPANVLAELLVRTEAAKVTEDYDIAVSFAPAQLDYVEQTVAAARALGLKVFYDRDLSNAWWGRNFIIEQRKIYGQRALHFVPFISTEYLASPHPLDGFHQAIVKAIAQQNRYILPVLVGNVTVPPHLLNPHIGNLRADHNAPEELAAHMAIAVNESRATNHQTRDFGTVLHDALR